MIKINSIIPKLPAKDLEATRLFYTEKLNFKVINTYPDYLLIQRDNMEIHFFLHRQLDINRNDGMCYVRVTNIEELHKGLKDSNFPNLGKLETRPWRQKEFSICDNQNNQITFGEAV
jgi:catechol 2,3-dioxygenase-like lactoylglutathione lyase family enzyme